MVRPPHLPILQSSSTPQHLGDFGSFIFKLFFPFDFLHNGPRLFIDIKLLDSTFFKLFFLLLSFTMVWDLEIIFINILLLHSTWEILLHLFHFPFYFLSPWSEIIYSKRKRLNCKEILCIRKCLCILTYFHQLFSAISSNYKIKSKYEKLGKIIWPGEGFQIRFDFFCWSWTGFCFLFLDFSET